MKSRALAREILTANFEENRVLLDELDATPTGERPCPPTWSEVAAPRTRGSGC
jgi:hypothetical protein